MAAYRVVTDIQYVNGALAGLRLYDGWTVTEPTKERATKTAALLDKDYRQRKLVRAGMTRNYYRIISPARVHNLEGNN